MRKEIKLNEAWLFHKGDIKVERPLDKGPIYSQSKTERKLMGPACYNYYDSLGYIANNREIKNDGWIRVDLPHDYVVDQDLCQTENNALGYLHYDNAWYRKRFVLEQEDCDKRILLRFDGIAGKATVYLNGCLMYHNFSSYNTFEIDISDYAYFDKENIIAIYVNTEEFEGWWYQGGGIYRDVYLIVTEPVAIDLWGVYAPYKKISDTEWKINFETCIVNCNYTDCSVTVKSSLIDKNGNIVLSAEGSGRVPLRDKYTVRYSGTINNPYLWDTENPNLYIVKTVLELNGKEIDFNTTRIGFRTVELSADEGLLINGKKTFINGVCAHQDYGLTGLAVTDNVARYKVKLMKEMGANGYRTVHYQQTEGYMNAFDEMGFLVMNETRWFESTRESIEQLESLVKRDRNRPSVIFWSTSNEEALHITDNGKRIHRALAEHIRKLDDTRFITAAVSVTPEKCTIYDYCDIVGINYNLAIYDEIHKMYPDKILFSSECCATGTTRDWNFLTDTNGRIRDFDVDTDSWFLGREKTYKFLHERKFIIGAYQWAAVEHRGEAVWPRICSASGALDLFLQKKGAFYQNKSHWTEKPMVHIVPHWNFNGLEGEEIFVPVYTNCEELELFLNGESLGKKAIEKYGHGEWTVKYAKGTLSVKGYIGGKAVAMQEKTTTGKPVSLKLTLENDFHHNGEDIAIFTCECLDENGLIVPDASETVSFSVGTPAKILGTGSDNCDHTRISSNTRKMYMGKVSVAVKSSKEKPIELMAESADCGIAKIVV